MSSSTTSVILQPHHVHNLILILRRSNAHYSRVASRIRASFASTGYAKTRAQDLGLTVDVVAAVNCPQKQVSVIPLPILEVVTPPCEAIQSVIRTRPVLTCSIPPVVQTITSPNGTTSALSTGSVHSSITIASGQPKNASVRSYWSAVTDDEDLFPRDAIDADSSDVRSTEPVEAQAVWQPLDAHIDEDDFVWNMDLQYPEDSASMDVCISPSSGSEAGSESSDHSGSSSASSFSGPVTPPETLPLMIRIKRKSMEIRDSDCEDDMTDKRVRVFRDEAIRHQRRNVIRIPARR
ncbi:hypothetical protein C0992_010340 [Termitomyces sp. T32_za158]|nr:hypothetical protein C0992_010340 [Termitomyces sp. T32_za158]